MRRIILKRYEKFDIEWGVISQFQLDPSDRNCLINSVSSNDGRVLDFQHTKMSGYITIYGIDLEEIYVFIVEPLTVKRLIEGLENLLTHGSITEDDYVFYHLPDMDEGSFDSLRPVGDIGAPNIKFFNSQKDMFDKLRKMEGVSISFVSPNLVHIN